MRRAKIFMVGWALLSLLPLLPLLLGLEFDVAYARNAGAYRLPRAWVSRIGFVAVGLSIPMFVNLFIMPHRFVSHMAMKTGGLLAGITLIVISELNISDDAFAEYVVCVMMMLGTLTRGMCLGELYCAAASQRIKWASTLYFVTNSGYYCHKILKYYYCADSTSEAVWSAIDMLPQLYMSLACMWELRGKEFGPSNARYKFSLYYASFGILKVFLRKSVSLYVGALPPLAVIMGTYVNMVISFVFAGLFLKDKSLSVEESLDSKRSFVRYIAHEMRTPLNVSIIGLQMAMNEVDRKDTAPGYEDAFNYPLLADMLVDSSNAVEEAADTLNELLTFDKIESGKFEIEPERLHIQTIIHTVYRSFFLQANQKELKYEIDCSASLNDVYVMADKKKITQCLRNYISNALKFTPEEGTVTVRAYLLPSAGGGGEGGVGAALQVLRVEVVDTGVGIEKHNLAKVFHEVVQFNAAKLQGGGGSGLGMTITKAIMDAHKGIVGAVSEFGSGTTFYLEMAAEVGVSEVALTVQTNLFESSFIEIYASPLAPAVEVIATMSQPKEEVKQTEILVDRILVVDDSSVNLKMMKKLLLPFANEILLAENGIQAAEIVACAQGDPDKSQHIDIVVTDYHMPLLNGLQLTAQLRASGYLGFIALITGDNSNESDLMTRFNHSGGNLILSKPIRMIDITRMILSLSQLGPGELFIKRDSFQSTPNISCFSSPVISRYASPEVSRAPSTNNLISCNTML
jgi:signal transduction histidine kinase/DNA-binding NarL/FixJ family response regulator